MHKRVIVARCFPAGGSEGIPKWVTGEKHGDWVEQGLRCSLKTNKPTNKKKQNPRICFLTQGKYTRFLFKHLTPISSSHPSLHIRSSCSLEIKGREIRQLLVRVTKEMGLHEALERELCSWGVFSGLGGEPDAGPHDRWCQGCILLRVPGLCQLQ